MDVIRSNPHENAAMYIKRNVGIIASVNVLKVWYKQPALRGMSREIKVVDLTDKLCAMLAQNLSAWSTTL